MIIKTTIDREKAKSMLNLVEDRGKFVSSANMGEFSTIIVENYYEIIKELATAILLLDGLKTMGENAHKELIDYMLNYKELTEDEIFLANDLRIKRNKSNYEGKMIPKEYLEDKKDKIVALVKKLKGLLHEKLA